MMDLLNGVLIEDLLMLSILFLIYRALVGIKDALNRFERRDR